MKQRVLITGITGFVGKALSVGLASRGYTVIGVTLSNRGNETTVSQNEGLELVTLPASEPAKWAAILDTCAPDVAINTAAAGVRTQDRSWPALVDGNIVFPCRLLASLPDRCRLVLQLGSWLEYAEGLDGEMLKEDSLLTGTNMYGVSKYTGTQSALAIAQARSIPAVVLRLFHVYGPGERSARLIPYLIDGIAKGDKIKLGSKDKVRDFLFIEDFVEAVDRALECGEALSRHQYYNVCTGTGSRLDAVAESVAQTLDKTPNVEFGSVPDRSDEPLIAVGNGRLFSEVTGWAAKHCLDEGVRRTTEVLLGDAA